MKVRPANPNTVLRAQIIVIWLGLHQSLIQRIFETHVRKDRQVKLAKTNKTSSSSTFLQWWFIIKPGLTENIWLCFLHERCESFPFVHFHNHLIVSKGTVTYRIIFSGNVSRYCDENGHYQDAFYNCTSKAIAEIRTDVEVIKISLVVNMIIATNRPWLSNQISKKFCHLTYSFKL